LKSRRLTVALFDSKVCYLLLLKSSTAREDYSRSSRRFFC